MKKISFIILVLCLVACSHTSEQVVGYNEDGLTLVRVCTSYGDPMYTPDAYGSSCVLELRDYGRITNSASTINVISDERR